MTTVDPNEPIDFTAQRAKAAEEAAAPAADSPSKSHTLDVGTKQYPLVVKVPVINQGKIEDAFSTGKVEPIVNAIALIVAKPYREQFVEYALADPEDEADIVDVQDLVGAYEAAQEKITARPLRK